MQRSLDMFLGQGSQNLNTKGILIIKKWTRYILESMGQDLYLNKF